jgi:hemerythrin-like metal-binding protein
MTEGEVATITEMADKFNKIKTRKKFDELILQMKIFFRKEEELYQDHNHPDARQHTKIHQELERVAAHFEETYFNQNKKTKSVLDEFCLYIKNWTMLHFECYDKSMMPYIRISQYIKEAAA